MEEINKIDIKQLCAKIILKKGLYIKVLSIVLVVSALWIFPQPRYYKCNIQLAPESASEGTIGSLGSLASSFGVNLGGMSSSDAIYPSIYPHVVSSNDFIIDLLNSRVKTQDGDVDTTYYCYIKNHTKVSIWSKPYHFVRRLIKGLLPKKNAGNPNKTNKGIDKFWMTEDENAIVGIVANNISCIVDEEYQVVNITVTDQDRLVCATIADEVRKKLQKYITDYRTSKARNDLKYFEKLVRDAKEQYDRACDEFSDFSDTHFNPTMKRTSLYMTRLENNMNQAYTTYNGLLVQLQTAEAKVQENTPAFTIIQGASVPIKPAGPKRMFFCLGMLVLGFMGTSVYILRKDIWG